MPWITFTDGSAGYCEADFLESDIETAERITGKTAIELDTLPYPARPIIFQRGTNPCPPFCSTPDTCKGRLSCPKSYACSD